MIQTRPASAVEPAGSGERESPPGQERPGAQAGIDGQPDVTAILVVDRDRSTASAVRLALLDHGMAVSVSSGVRQALGPVTSDSPDLALLTAGDEHDLLRHELGLLQAASVPVIVLGPRPASRVLCEVLDAGAEDWVAWPFHPEELAARCRAVLRRRRVARPQRLVLGGVEIDLEARVARGPMGPLALTASDWLLLDRLARKPGAVVSHGELGATSRPAESVSALARARVARLRSRLARAGAPGTIRLVSGRGYRLEPG